MSERAAKFLASFSRWLNVRRVTAHATIAACLIWLMFAFDMATPGYLDRVGNLKGTDFLHFYTTGTFARAHLIAKMYSLHRFAAAAASAIPGVSGWHYLPVYPPQIALMFWPFAYVSYLTGFAIWSIINFAMYAGCVAMLARMYPKLAAYRFAMVAAALAFPPFFNAIGHGQISILVLACVTISFAAFASGRPLAAGIALGCVAFKPPIFLAFLIACAAVRAYRVIAGMAVVAALQLAITVIIAGLDSVFAYIAFAIKLPHVDRIVLAVKPYQMHSIRSFWMLLGAGRFESALYAASSIAVLALIVTFWRRESRPDMRFATLIVAAVLIDPHLYIYDAVIIAPALAVAIARARELGDTPAADGIRVAVYLLFVCLFAGPIARIIHVQLSVPILCALLFAMTRTTVEQMRTALPVEAAASGV